MHGNFASFKLKNRCIIFFFEKLQTKVFVFRGRRVKSHWIVMLFSHAMNRHIFNGVGLSLPREHQAEVSVMWGWCLRKRNIKKMVFMRYGRRFPLFTLEYQLFRWWKFVISLYVTKYQLLKRNETKFFDYISKSIYFNLWCCTKCGKWNRTLSKQLELCLKSRRLIVNLR